MFTKTTAIDIHLFPEHADFYFCPETEVNRAIIGFTCEALAGNETLKGKIKIDARFELTEEILLTFEGWKKFMENFRVEIITFEKTKPFEDMYTVGLKEQPSNQ